MTISPLARRATAGTLAAALALLPWRARARSDDERIEIGAVDIRSLLDLSVESVTRRSERASDAPAAVFVLTREDVRRGGYRTVDELLGAAPGLFAYPGNFPQVGVRGMGILGDLTTRLLVLVDGHPLANAMGHELGRGFPLPLDAIEKVEVIKGPVGSVYGPSAFLGVVNLVTADGRAGGEAWVGAEAAQGGLSAKEASATWRGSPGGLALLVSAGAHATPGTELRFPDVPGGLTLDRRDFGDDASAYLRARLGDLTVAAGCGRTFNGLPYAAAAPSAARRTYDEAIVCFSELAGTLHVGDRLTLRSRASFDAVEQGATLARAAPPADLGRFTHGGHDRWGTAEVRADWRVAGALRLDLGATGQYHAVVVRSTYDALPVLDVSSQRRFGTLNAWALAEGRLHPLLTLHGGVTYFTHQLFGDRLSPKLAAVWQPGTDDTVKAIWSSGFRPPTFVEAIFGDQIAFVANPDLGPETVTSLELVHEHRLSGQASIGTSLFWNEYRDLIRYEVIPAPGLDHVPDPANPADFRQIARNDRARLGILGAELALALRMGDRVSGHAGVSVQRTRGTADRANFPTLTANAAVSTRAAWRPLQLTVRGAFASSRDKIADRLVPGQRTSVPEAFSLAVLAALDVPGVPGLQVDAGLMNVLGRTNPSPAPGDTAPISELPEAPRTLRLSVRFSR